MKDLFGHSKKDRAIKLLQDLEPPEGYYLAFSGGKDSVAVKHLCDLARVRYDAHYSLTTVDPPELVKFVRVYHPDVDQHLPDKTMAELIIENKIPPTRLMRYCCAELKERYGNGRVIVTGIRSAESPRRAKRKQVESCYRMEGTVFINPIFDWKDQEVWGFIRDEKIPYCKLYDEGFSRLGCIGCPMGGRTRELEFSMWPGMQKYYLKAFDEMLKARKNSGLKCTWQTPEEVFSWWMEAGKPEKGGDDEQTVFDF